MIRPYPHLMPSLKTQTPASRNAPPHLPGANVTLLNHAFCVRLYRQWAAVSRLSGPIITPLHSSVSAKPPGAGTEREVNCPTAEKG